MKLFHISDLHIGKQLHFYNLRDNQVKILSQIVSVAKDQHPDAIIIAGDIYDKSVPSAEAYMIFDRFLNELSDITPSIPILIIAGNHDSAERLNYASTFLEKHNIYISVLPPQTEEEYLKKVILKDEYGDVNFYLLPFTKPGYVRHLFDEGTVTGYDAAIAALIDREQIDYSQRNVLISHQFYVSGDKLPDTCDSEQIYISVGGIDSIDIASVKQFDYVALGHLHGPQQIGEKHIRYSGAPLKYSVSEEKHNKSITMVTIAGKGEEVKYPAASCGAFDPRGIRQMQEKSIPALGSQGEFYPKGHVRCKRKRRHPGVLLAEVTIEKLPLTAVQDVRKETGTLSEVISRATEANRHDFISITLTDEADVYKPKEQLEEYYDFILEVRAENSRTRAQLLSTGGEAAVLDPLEAFREFYQEMNNEPMNKEEEKIIMEVIDIAKEAEK